MIQIQGIELTDEADPSVIGWAEAYAGATGEVAEKYFRPVGAIALEQEAA